MTTSFPFELRDFARQQQRTDAPDSPDERVICLDIGLYGHVGCAASFFWYRSTGALHAHQTEILEPDDNLFQQLAGIEYWAEQYQEYRYHPPTVVIGTTVLSPSGRMYVREALDRWLSPPHRRRLINVGDYAGEQATTRGLVSRKKLRDLLLIKGQRHKSLTLTPDQHRAVTLYTGKRIKPGRDEGEDTWRMDETDAVALPVAYAVFAARYLLPPADPSPAEREAELQRAAHAWEIERGLAPAEAMDWARRYGHPFSEAARLRTGEPETWERPIGEHAARPPRGALDGLD